MAHRTNRLGETFARVRALDAELGRAEIGASDGAGWWRFDAVAGNLDALLDAANATGDRRRDYLGASVAAALVDGLVAAALPALLLERRLPDVALAKVQARLHPGEFWFGRVAVASSRMWVLPDDPARDDLDARVVRSLDDLHRRLADALVAAGRAWFPAVRSRAPFGQIGMWGQLADELCGAALWTARAAGLHERHTWNEAIAVTDHMARQVPELRVRPRPFPVRYSGGESLWQVKGTCCLWYTTTDDSAGDGCGEGYCTGCPLRTDADRHDRLRAYLESEAHAG